MKKFKARIDKESELALKELAKSSIQFIYSPSANVCFGSSIITVQNLSIRLGNKKFLIIQSNWKDTPKEWIDYYDFNLRIEDRPKDVTVNESSNGKDWTYIMDHLSYHIGKLKKVVSVEVLENYYVGSEETVQYDAGIIINLEDSSQLVISRDESCHGDLQVALLPEENIELLCELKSRVKYHA